MAKQDRRSDTLSFLQNIGGYALLLLVITLGALIPLKIIEVVFNYPVLEEMADFAREPADVKTRSSNP